MLGAFCLFCGVMLLAGWLVMLRDWIASASWLQVQGTVRGVAVDSSRQSDPYRPWHDRDGFRPIVRYAYTVEDQTYVGTRYSATREPFFLQRSDAERFVERFPLQASLQVRVNTSNPKISLLERQLSPADALPGYLGLACLLVGLLTL